MLQLLRDQKNIFMKKIFVVPSNNYGRLVYKSWNQLENHI